LGRKYSDCMVGLSSFSTLIQLKYSTFIFFFIKNRILRLLSFFICSCLSKCFKINPAIFLVLLPFFFVKKSLNSPAFTSLCFYFHRSSVNVVSKIFRLEKDQNNFAKFRKLYFKTFTYFYFDIILQSHVHAFCKRPRFFLTAYKSTKC
jgi:hypothetical protein